MPPIHRYHAGPVAVPPELVDAIDSAFDGGGHPEEFGLHGYEVVVLRRLCRIPRYRGMPVNTDARHLSRARNVLDGWTLGSSCETTKEKPAFLGDGCDFCLWCQALLLRDWCDHVLDLAGFTDRSPYIEPANPNHDYLAEYDRTWDLVNKQYAATQEAR